MSDASLRVHVRRLFASKWSSRRKVPRAYPPMIEALEGRAVLSGDASAALLHSSESITPIPKEIRGNSEAQVETLARPGRKVHDRHGLRGGMIVDHNIPFPTVDDRTEDLDLYRPAGPAPAGGWPVIVAIHGGGWTKFSKGEYGPRVAAGFVDRGFAVVAPNYLLSRPGSPTWPINLEDVQSAVRWTRSQAGALGLDSNRIVAMGESAGGHLAEMLGTGSPATPDSGVSDKVSAVVAFSGPADLTSLVQESPLAGDRVIQFQGGPPSALQEAYNDASPVDQVRAGDPPMFLVHGSADPLVPVAQSEEMDAALAASGIPHRLIIVRGAGHGLDFPAQHANLIPQILAFLNATWNDET